MFYCFRLFLIEVGIGAFFIIAATGGREGGRGGAVKEEKKSRKKYYMDDISKIHVLQNLTLMIVTKRFLFEEE
jgi:hypothetical protein